MKKILFVIYGLHNKGGSERVTVELANALSKKYDIHIIYKESSHIAYKLDQRVKLVTVDKSGVALLFSIKKHIKDHDYDVVVIHSMNRLTVGLLLTGLTHPFLISLEHTSSINSSYFIRFLKKLIFNKINKVIVLSKKDKNFYDNFHNSVYVIYNPSPFSIEKKYHSKNKKIISIGSLDKNKGFDRLIEAWKKVELYDNDFVLEIYGEGEERKKLEMLIEKYRLKRVFLMGKTENVYDVYKTAAFFVMTSHFEGLPMVLIEAQSLGLPIISYDCPNGPAEIVNHNINGYLVENNNQENLTEKILELIKNEGIRNQFSDNAILSAKKFRKEIIVQKWIDIIEGHFTK